MEQENPRFHYISGRSATNPEYFTIPPHPNGQPAYLIGFNFDNEGDAEDNFASLGIGVYKIQFWWNGLYPGHPPNDSCWIEFDPGHCITPGYPVVCDINIEFKDDNNNPRIEFAWNSCPMAPISSVNRYITSWYQCEGRSRPKNNDFLIYDNTVSTYFDNKFPFDSRVDCSDPNVGYENHCFTSDSSGVLGLRLSIQKSIATRTSFISSGCGEVGEYYTKNIIILPQGELEIYNNITLTLSQYSNWNNAAKLYVKGVNLRYDYYQNGLVLQNNAQVLVKPKSSLYLERYSRIWLNYSNSYIIAERGALLCNYGAIIRGPGRIIQSGVSLCPAPDAPFEQVYTNGAQLILQDSADVYVPSNCTVIFDSSSALIMKPDTKMHFGENAQLIFKNGA